MHLGLLPLLAAIWLHQTHSTYLFMSATAVMGLALQLNFLSFGVAAMFVASQPTLLRGYRAPRRPRRFHSTYEGVEAVWETVVVRIAEQLAAQGMPDKRDEIYLKLFRIDKAAFEELYGLAAPGIDTQRATNARQPIPARKRMAIFLCWLAHGHKQDQLAFMFAVSQPVVSKILKQCRKAFLEHVVPVWLPTPPTGGTLLDVEAGFHAEAGLPLCVGAVDGTFFHINRPLQWAQSYWCYKRHYGIMVLACCTSQLKFTWVACGDAGSVGDAHVWNTSVFKQHLLAGTFDLPEAAQPRGEALPHLQYPGREAGPRRAAVPPYTRPLHTYMVADSAFALDERVMKCYDAAVGHVQDRFNHAVIRTRRVIENAFGHLKMRWNICFTNHITDPALATDVAYICCALHNFCEERCTEHIGMLGTVHAAVKDMARMAGHSDAARRAGRRTRAIPTPHATEVRDALARYMAGV